VSRRAERDRENREVFPVVISDGRGDVSGAGEAQPSEAPA
jgi:Mg-chelatase subunit ChlD